MENLETVVQEGKRRLNPSLTNPSYLVLRERRKIFAKWLANVEGENLVVLDVGGRIQPYRPLLEKRLSRYVAVDLRPTPLVSIVARGEQMPLADSSFDVAICSQVLEYVTEPAVVLAEIHRLLKPGGCLLLSAPAIFPRDSDQDIWRFSPPGLRLLLRQFNNVEIVAEGSSIVGFFRSACMGLLMFARSSFMRRLVCFTLVPVLNIVAAALEAGLGSANDQFSANFSVLAQK